MDKAANNSTLYLELSKLYSDLYPDQLLYFNRYIAHTIHNIAQDIIKFAYTNNSTIDNDSDIDTIDTLDNIQLLLKKVRKTIRLFKYSSNKRRYFSEQLKIMNIKQPWLLKLGKFLY
jgi:beta-xylosidase